MNAILSPIYNANANIEKTEYLYHSIGMQGFESHLGMIQSNGLQIENNPSDWADIDAILPNRPHGTFFWGENNKPATWTLRIRIEALDTSKLFAFPAALAHAAWEMTQGAELIDGAVGALAQAHAVPFAEYNGEFPAEFIYTGDIPSDLIEWQHYS